MKRLAWNWLGLVLLVSGSCLWLLPMLPVRTESGTPMAGVPDWPWAAAAISLAGAGLLLWQRQRDGEHGR